MFIHSKACCSYRKHFHCTVRDEYVSGNQQLDTVKFENNLENTFILLLIESTFSLVTI